MPPQSQELKVTDLSANCPRQDQLCGFKEGMVVIIFDSTGHFDTFEITNVQDDAAHLQHRGQDLNYSYDDGRDASPRAVSNTYYRDRTTNQLMRYNGGDRPTRRLSTTWSTCKFELLRRSESAEDAQTAARRSELPL